MNSSRRILTPAVGARRFLSLPKVRSWSKSSPVHVTAILVGCVAFEFFYGAVTDGIWESLNKGVSDNYLNIFILNISLIFSETLSTLPYG